MIMLMRTIYFEKLSCEEDSLNHFLFLSFFRTFDGVSYQLLALLNDQVFIPQGSTLPDKVAQLVHHYSSTIGSANLREKYKAIM